MKKKKILVGVYSLVLIFFISGCATITPEIKYKPVLPAQKSKNVSVTIKEFLDGRPVSEKGIIGQTYNAYDMKVGDVLEPKDLLSSMQKSLVDELTNAGYQLTENRKGVVIKATVENVSCGYRNAISANVRIKFEVFEKDTKVLDHLYGGDSGNQPLFNQDYCGKPLTKCVQDIVTTFVKDLDKYVAS